MFTSVKSLAAIQATKVSFFQNYALFRNRTNVWVSSAPLHFTFCIQPICANTWSLVQYTALQLGPVTLQATTSHYLGKKGGELRGGGKRPNNHQCKQGRLDTERVPCITGSYGVQSKCNKEGQDNNLLVAMKQEVCARSLLAEREGKKTEGKEKSIFLQTKIILSLI